MYIYMQQQYPELTANVGDLSQQVTGDKSVNSSLMSGKRAFAVESPSAILHAAEECHLLCGAE